ncbi:hypothetical protein E2C01_102707 [Portunus trituberculatus]|uniref:Uncharacterized protein n=1 Tax=Portunus trituberculatus TaxID=210409 RepID=A0A5B7KJ46_PORTR|nr:hypothetical protein [Portunus trituberculatus]
MMTGMSDGVMRIGTTISDNVPLNECSVNTPGKYFAECYQRDANEVVITRSNERLVVGVKGKEETRVRHGGRTTKTTRTFTSRTTKVTKAPTRRLKTTSDRVDRHREPPLCITEGHPRI